MIYRYTYITPIDFQGSVPLRQRLGATSPVASFWIIAHPQLRYRWSLTDGGIQGRLGDWLASFSYHQAIVKSARIGKQYTSTPVCIPGGGYVLHWSGDHILRSPSGHKPDSNDVTVQSMISDSDTDGPLTRYAELWVAHASWMPRTFSLPLTSKEIANKRSRHSSRHVCHARATMHVGIANPRWGEKGSRHSRRMRNRNFMYLVRSPCYSNGIKKSSLECYSREHHIFEL